MDRLREVVNEAGAGYVFRRDLAGNISSEKDYGGIERIYHRDGCGRVTRIERPEGRSTAYTYDTMGRVLTAEYHDGTKEEYGYDRNGLMATAYNGEARMVFERDPVGRVTKETMGFPEATGSWVSCRWSRNTTHTASAPVWEAHSEPTRNCHTTGSGLSAA
ncbi:hypothetical protein ACIXQX_23335 [Bacteroides fragilis]